MNKKMLTRVFKTILACLLLLSSWPALFLNEPAYANTNNYSTSLANLTADGYSLSPSFSPQTFFYTVHVPFSKSSIGINAVAQDSRATVSIQETSGGSQVPLNPGPNLINISVVDPSGSSKLYTINVIRSNIGLMNLFIDAGSLNRPFDPNVTGYSINIPRTLSYVNVTAMADSSGSGAAVTIKINEQTVNSGVPTAIPIDKVSSLLIEVSSANSERKFYTVTLNRSASNSADLGHLHVEGVTLNRNFDPEVTEYTARVNLSVSEIKLSPIYGSNIRTVSIRGQHVPSGSYHTVPLAVGENDIAVDAESYDGTKKTYYLTVTRLTSNSGTPVGGWNDGGGSGSEQFAFLSNLTLDKATLQRPFDSNVLEYYATVGNNVSNVGVSASFPSGITAKINEKSVASGQYHYLNLKTGENQVSIEVRSSSGDIRYYIVKILRFAHDSIEGGTGGGGGDGGHIGDNTAILSNLLVDGLVLDKRFESKTTDYFATAEHELTSFRLSPLYNPSRVSVKINGYSVGHGEFFWQPLEVGINTVTIEVQPTTGAVSKYLITVVRLAQGQTDPGGTIGSGSLLSIGTSNVTLDRSFQPNEYVYRGFTSQETFKFTPVISNSAKLRINGVFYSSNQEVSISLSYGNNSIAAEVIPNEGGTARTYTFTISRGDYSSEQYDISSVIIPGVQYNPAFTNQMDYYYATVHSGLTEIELMVMATGANTLTANGKNLVNGELSQPIPLSFGDNKIELKVQSYYGGSAKTYTFWINRNHPDEETNYLRPYVTNGDLVVPISSASETYISYNKLKEQLESQTINKIRFKIGSKSNVSEPNYVVLSDSMLDYLRNNGKWVIVEAPEAVIQTDPRTISSSGVKVSFEKNVESVGQVPSGFTAYSSPYAIKLEGMNKEGLITDKDSIQATVNLQSEWAESELAQAEVYQYTEAGDWRLLPSKPAATGKQFDIMGSSRIAIMKPSAPEEVQGPDSFPDITNHWAKMYIDYLASRSIINGYEDGTFGPEKEITRAEFVTLLVTMLQIEAPPAYSSFKDVNQGDWYYNAVITGADHRLIEGYDTGEFKPNDKISREEVAVVLERLMRQRLGIDVSITDQETDSLLRKFEDADAVSWWAKKAVAVNIKLDAMNGMTERELAPLNKATRAQIAALLYKIITRPESVI